MEEVQEQEEVKSTADELIDAWDDFVAHLIDAKESWELMLDCRRVVNVSVLEPEANKWLSLLCTQMEFEDGLEHLIPYYRTSGGIEIMKIKKGAGNGT